MAQPKKTKRQLADEAWLRSQQIDLSGQLEAEPVTSSKIAEDSTIPRLCPHCQRMMTLEHGWTISRTDERLICGYCGGLVTVPTDALDALRAQMQALFAERATRLAPLPKSKHGPKVRGAG